MSERKFASTSIRDSEDKLGLTPQQVADLLVKADEAKNEALEAQSTADTARSEVGNLNTYIDVAFKNGIIEEAEAKAIEKYKNTINETMSKVEASYAVVWNNSFLSNPYKENLKKAKTDLWEYQRDVLLSTIDTAIEDGKTTVEEKDAVDIAFSDFNDLMSDFQSALEEANKAIQDSIYSLTDSKIYDLNDEIDNDIRPSLAGVIAKANQAAAVTDEFSKISGGLTTGVLIELHEAEPDPEAPQPPTTAGLSGIQTDKDNVLPDNYMPAFWAGGTYDQAIGSTAKAIIRHDGSSKFTDTEITGTINAKNGNVGLLFIDKNGMLYTKDPVTDEVKFKINGGTLPSLASLLSNTFIGGSNTNTPQSDITDTYVLPNKLNITQDDSQINVNIGVTLFAQGSMTETSTAVAELWLYRDGEADRILGVVGLYSLGNGEIMNQQIEFSESVQNLVKGEYGIGIHIQTLNNPIYARANIGASTISWEFKRENVQRLEIALNGMMQFYTEAHWYFTKNGFDLRGKTNMPGVLASGTVAANGGQTNTWGAKASTGGTSTVTGGRRVPLLNLTHNEYTVQITPHTSTDPFRVGAKTTTGFEALGTGAFDYTVIGRNY